MRNERAAESGNAILRIRSGTKAKNILASSVRSEYKLQINVIKVNQNLDQCCEHLEGGGLQQLFCWWFMCIYIKNMPRNKLMKKFSWALVFTEFNLNNHSDFANNNNNNNNSNNSSNYSNNVMPILDTSSIWFTSLSSCVAFFLACGFTGFFLACLLGLAFFPFFLFFCQTFWLLA